MCLYVELFLYSIVTMDILGMKTEKLPFQLGFSRFELSAGATCVACGRLQHDCLTAFRSKNLSERELSLPLSPYKLLYIYAHLQRINILPIYTCINIDIYIHAYTCMYIIFSVIPVFDAGVFTVT